MPTKSLARLGCVSDQLVNFGRPVELWVDLHIALPVVDAHVRKGRNDEVTDAVSRASGNHIVIRLILLKHLPHRLNVVSRKAQIALRVEVAQYQLILLAYLDSRYTSAYFARHEFVAPTTGFMIEQYS